MGQARLRGTLDERKAKAIKQANLVILSSPDPQANGPDWTPVLPENVPMRLRRPDVIGSLVKGLIVKEIDGNTWYRAERA